MRTFIDLFCGIGGFRIALEKKGLKCVFSSEIDPHAQEAYFNNFGEKPAGDITKIPAEEIPKHDILCAGFPCQSFSAAGKRGGLEDTRGELFYEIIRIAQYHKPLVMILENVKNIVSMDGGKTIKTIQTKLDEIGYNVHIHVLNASNFGVPQARERVYFACLRKDTETKDKLKYKEPRETLKQVYLENILEKEVKASLYINRQDISITEKPTENQLKPIRVGIVGKGGQGERIYSPKGHAITLSAYGGGVGAKTGLYLDNDRIRRLSITEAKRVMGFGDSHYVSNGTQGYQQLGNAVIPKMVEHVYKNIKNTENKHLNKPSLPFIKWVGGKRLILKELLPRIPKNYKKYYEPFVGGGAMFYALRPENAYISDVNSRLITTYETVKNEIDTVVNDLKIHSILHCKSYYLECRDEFNCTQDLVKIAGLFIT